MKRQVLALDIGGTKLAAAVVGEDGALSDRHVIETAVGDGAERVLESALELVAGVLESQPGDARPRVLGVSTKGLTREEGVLLSGMPGWSGLRIPAMLRQRFPGLTFATLNDVKAATLAELVWGSLRGVSHGLYVNLGTGIAAGIVADGRLVDGAHGAAGEIGYLVPERSMLSRCRPPGTELPAPLEGLVGGGAVPRRARAALGKELTMAQLVAESRDDPGATELVEDILSELVLWVVNVSVVLDPERVVIGGGFLGGGPEVCRKIAKALDSSAPFSPEVLPAHFGTESALVGAGALAFSMLEPAGLSGRSRRGTSTRFPIRLTTELKESSP
jgi:glucokinase